MNKHLQPKSLHGNLLVLFQVPYLIDPNTGTQISDYRNILSYLFQTYSVAVV